MVSKFFVRLSQALIKKDGAPEDAPQTIFGVGALIDQRYRLEAEIGRGGMGIVYRAYDIPNNRAVAIKIINLDKANALTRQQFLREAEIMARLNHPHIVNVFDTGVVDTGAPEPSPFIVMELVQGISLADLRGLTYARSIDLGKQICAALEYAHSQGVVYRDLKPGNVLIEKHGFHYYAKLADFGLARPRGTGSLPNESNAAGTVFYLAPELIAGGAPDIASDLYALGATLYEMITGRVPFSDFDEQTILAQHVNESVAPPSQSRADVPPALETIILRLLAKNPNDRFASAREVGQALGQVVILRGPVRGNLPQPLPDFVANESDLAQIKQLLASNQLVTLLGDNTAPAIIASAQLADQFWDGVWFVDLKPLNDPVSVLPAVASVFDIHEDLDCPLTVALIAALREKNLLLLLVHCDQYLDACALLIETIIRMCPEVHILAISRQPLKITGEECYQSL